MRLALALALPDCISTNFFFRSIFLGCAFAFFVFLIFCLSNQKAILIDEIMALKSDR